jgi:hypothetical protein
MAKNLRRNDFREIGNGVQNFLSKLGRLTVYMKLKKLVLLLSDEYGSQQNSNSNWRVPYFCVK